MKKGLPKKPRGLRFSAAAAAAVVVILAATTTAAAAAKAVSVIAKENDDEDKDPETVAIVAEHFATLSPRRGIGSSAAPRGGQ